MVRVLARALTSIGQVGLVWIAITVFHPHTANGQTVSIGNQIEATYNRAVTSFDSSDVTAAEPLLDQVVDGVSNLVNPLTSLQRNWLIHGLALRSQVRLDLDNTDGAEKDIAWLLHLDPEYRFDQSVVSPKFVTMLDDAREKQSGRIRFPETDRAKMWIDGRRIDGTQVVAAAPGRHDVTVEIGVNRQSMPILVGNRAVDVTWPAAIASTSARATQAPQVQPPLGGSSQAPVAGSSNFLQVFIHPPRILFARLDGMLDAKERKGFDRPQVGGAIRIWKHLAIGATRVGTTGNFDNVDQLDPSDPERTRGIPAGPMFSGLELSRDIWHIEVAATGGNDNWEGSVYAGPSFVKATIGVPRTNINDSFKTVGGHIGFDVSWFPLRYVGVGGGARYTRAILDLSVRGDTTSLILEAAQVSIGARVRF